MESEIRIMQNLLTVTDGEEIFRTMIHWSILKGRRISPQLWPLPLQLSSPFLE